MDVLALALFGVMLFSKTDSFVADAAIKAFLALKTLAENPVTAILADSYIALDQCHSGKRKIDSLLLTYFVCLANCSLRRKCCRY